MLYNEYLNKDLLTPADVAHLLRRSAICFSLHNSKKSLSSVPVFSLNFSSAGKGPFRDGKAKNIYFSKRGGGGGGGTVE